MNRVIRIVKPADPPAVLRDRGEPARRRHEADYDADPDAYRAEGARPAQLLSFNDGLYGHPDVVAALVAAQHGKCCFCERRQLGDVEHFRPKSGSQQADGQPLLRPGYYWLAYDWANLYFACGPCNQRFKRNLFPLGNPTRRARSHHDDTAAEEPLLLDPAGDPERHIGFREEVAYAVDGNPKGRATIDVLRLNREDLRETRQAHLARVTLVLKLLERLAAVAGRLTSEGRPVPPELVEQEAEVRAELVRYRSDRAEFLGMTRPLIQ